LTKNADMMLSVGVAGLGRMGRLHFLISLRSQGVNVVVIADPQRVNQKVAEHYHVKVYDD